MSLDACLPADLRGPSTAITRMAGGLSGASVYRVDAAGRAFVLKVATDHEPPAAWQRRLAILRAAADAGIAPPIVHVDEERRAITSALVADRSFPRLYLDPRTRDAAIELLGRTLRRVHELPLPPGDDGPPPRHLAGLASALGPVPPFAAETVQRVLAESPPPLDRPAVLSHNDVNPTNLTYDGAQLLLLDWDVAGANDPLYDLATIAVFLRMDDATARALLAAHDGAPVDALPARFAYDRRLVAALCGAMFLHLARLAGHSGSTGDAPPALAEVYQRLRTGELTMASGDGRWQFGLALLAAEPPGA